MRRHHIPMDLRQEEKIIGGYMSLRQIGYLLAGFMVGSFLAYAFSWLPIVFLPVAIGGFLGFGSVRGESGDRWLALIMNRRQREYYFFKRQTAEEVDPVVAQKEPKREKR